MVGYNDIIWWFIDSSHKDCDSIMISKKNEIKFTRIIVTSNNRGRFTQSLNYIRKQVFHCKK